MTSNVRMHPHVVIPLGIGDEEPLIDLKALLNQVCRKTAIDIVIDYQSPPSALSEEDFLWIQSLPTMEAASAYP